MHIAHVLGYLAAKYGGPPHVAVQLGRGVKEYGFEVSWWATASSAEEWSELKSFGTQGHIYSNSFPQSWYRSVPLQHGLEEAIGDIDLLHLHQVWEYPILAASRVARRHRKPYVITPHGIFSQEWRYKSFKKRVYLHLLALKFLQASSCIHALNLAEVDGLNKLGVTAPTTVIPNGVHADSYAKLPSRACVDAKWPRMKDQYVILFLGRLSPEKGVEHLVRSGRRVNQEYSNSLLVLAGPDHRGYGTTVRRLVEDLGLTDTIWLPGMVGGWEKLALLGRADLFVLPSYTEGASMAILEAMASGKPLVITTGCNFPEVEKVNAGEIIDLDQTCLESAILKMLALDDSDRLSMGERGKRLVLQKYTWDTIISKMIRVYQCILNGDSIPIFLD